jgi:drug/metabolite transporter (DMT)-like permease
LVVSGSLLLIYKPGTRLGGVPLKGIYCAVAASFFFAINNCFDKLAVQTASPTFSGFVMTLISAAFLLPGTWRAGGGAAQLHAHSKWFLLRGLFEVCFMVGKLAALIYLPAPYVMALIRGALILSIVGGKLAFHEPDFIKRLISGVLVALGLGVIVITLV